MGPPCSTGRKLPWIYKQRAIHIIAECSSSPFSGVYPGHVHQMAISYSVHPTPWLQDQIQMPQHSIKGLAVNFSPHLIFSHIPHPTSVWASVQPTGPYTPKGCPISLATPIQSTASSLRLGSLSVGSQCRSLISMFLTLNLGTCNAIVLNSILFVCVSCQQLAKIHEMYFPFSYSIFITIFNWS